MSIRAAIENVIRRNHLENWLEEYPWLIGFIGNPARPIWFIGENPSLRGVIAVHRRSQTTSENLQWNSHDGDRLLRESITEAGLKSGDPASDEGWKCYITNAIKEPEIVAIRNAQKRDKRYWQEQAKRWLPVLQKQIDSGAPRVLVAFGGQAHKILVHMKSLGLTCPPVIKINHYSYVMFRPEAGTRRGPRHPDRIAKFKSSISAVAKAYDA
jgi:hypothetical protein